MYHSGIDHFEAVRFLPDVLHIVDFDFPALEETDRLLAADCSIGICAFGFGVIFVLTENFVIGLCPGKVPAAMVPIGLDSIALAGILVDPIDLKPFIAVRSIWRDQVKPFSARSRRLPKWNQVARKQKIEWFDPVLSH